MKKTDLTRVKFYSKEDMASGYHLQKAVPILNSDAKPSYTDINDILELYNIKKYIDNEMYLPKWTSEDIEKFKHKVEEFGKIIGMFLSSINDGNIITIHESLSSTYISSFWELVNNQEVFKRISRINFKAILSKKPHLIRLILEQKKLTTFYSAELKEFMLTYLGSAEILLDVYVAESDFRKKQIHIPKDLTIQDKESIISNYLDSEDVNLNYLELIQNARKRGNFQISDKTKLKAKRLHGNELEKIFATHKTKSFRATISYLNNTSKIADVHADEDQIVNYSYSFEFIKENSDPYSLFNNFKYLFLYLDDQNRVDLVSKRSQIGVFEGVMGIRSRNEYVSGISFSISESTSHAQIVSYSEVIKKLNISIEGILQYVYKTTFPKKYSFANNALFSIPSTSSYLEKVRLLAPEFESILKQFKLFVENGSIDFELLEISSSPVAIQDVPSLNKDKYLYFNSKNSVMLNCSNLFFSDQALLAYVDPHKEKGYRTFFDVLSKEEILFSSYEDHQKPQLNYLIENKFIVVDGDGFIQMTNQLRVLILKDLHDNEVGSFHHYPPDFQQEAKQMEAENIIYFENTLFSKPEQSYFNYYLNKSEFTNGLDLRNRYSHGTQASPENTEKHKKSYFSFLKLMVLAFLKIEDDLNISKHTK